MLTVGAGFAPHDRPGVAVDDVAGEGDLLTVRFHVELLQVRRESSEFLRIRQDGLGVAPEIVAVVDPDHGQQHRCVAIEGCGAEVLVDHVEPVEELAEPVRADQDHQRQPDRRVDRVAPTDPVPEPEHVVGVDAEGGDPFSIRRHGDEVVGDRGVSQRIDQPGTRGAGIRQRLDRAEGLRGDDEQGRLGRYPLQRLVDVGAVDVGDEVAGDAGVAVRRQRLCRHGRPQVGAADADVDHVRDPLVAANPLGERGHRIEHLVHRLARRSRRRPRPRHLVALGALCGARARSSVTLMCSPANIASRRASTPAPRARSSRSLTTPSSSGCFE